MEIRNTTNIMNRSIRAEQRYKSANRGVVSAEVTRENHHEISQLLTSIKQTSEELLKAVEAVLSRNIYSYPDITLAITQSMRDENIQLPHENLSSREFEIFRLIATGLTVKEIAFQLNLSDKTVSTYLRRIRDKTKLSSHVQIARYALQNGIT